MPPVRLSVTLLAAALAVSVPASDAAARGHTVIGLAYLAHHAPVERARVWVTDARGHRISGVGRTNANGAFRVTARGPASMRRIVVVAAGGWHPGGAFDGTMRAAVDHHRHLASVIVNPATTIAARILAKRHAKTVAAAEALVARMLGLPPRSNLHLALGHSSRTIHYARLMRDIRRAGGFARWVREMHHHAVNGHVLHHLGERATGRAADGDGYAARSSFDSPVCGNAGAFRAVVGAMSGNNPDAKLAACAVLSSQNTIYAAIQQLQAELGIVQQDLDALWDKLTQVDYDVNATSLSAAVSTVDNAIQQIETLAAQSQRPSRADLVDLAKNYLVPVRGLATVFHNGLTNRITTGVYQAGWDTARGKKRFVTPTQQQSFQRLLTFWKEEQGRLQVAYNAWADSVRNGYVEGPDYSTAMTEAGNVARYAADRPGALTTLGANTVFDPNAAYAVYGDGSPAPTVSSASPMLITRYCLATGTANDCTADQWVSDMEWSNGCLNPLKTPVATTEGTGWLPALYSHFGVWTAAKPAGTKLSTWLDDNSDGALVSSVGSPWAFFMSDEVQCAYGREDLAYGSGVVAIDMRETAQNGVPSTSYPSVLGAGANGLTLLVRPPTPTEKFLYSGSDFSPKVS